MKGIIQNAAGELEIDPHNCKFKFEKWLKGITYSDGSYNLHTLKNISPTASALVTNYILDLYMGKNLAKGSRKGRRSYQHLANSRQRLRYLIELFETRYKKNILKITGDEVIQLFSCLRDGTILNTKGKPHLCVCTYAKVFAAFWRWIVRVKKKQGNPVEDVVESLDTSQDRKPKWSYFTLKDVEAMANTASSMYYKVLVYFLFDSGIRAPKELMNIRAKDISEVPNTNYLFLNIRNETSKTFGRKIKLMISSNLMRDFIKVNNFKGDDFIFTKGYVNCTRVISNFRQEFCVVKKTRR